MALSALSTQEIAKRLEAVKLHDDDPAKVARLIREGVMRLRLLEKDLVEARLAVTEHAETIIRLRHAPQPTDQHPVAKRRIQG